MSWSNKQSLRLFAEARKSFPGGVNSPVRAFRGVGGSPIFFRRGEGPYVWDVDGNRYIDFVGSWGPLIVGHSHPEVIRAVNDALNRGTSFGAPTEGETELARLTREFFPSMEVMRLVNSGTEAVMSVLRLARAFTAREKIVKFAGNYHGHTDALLVKAGSGVATFGLPDSPGVPASLAAATITVAYNDLAALREVFATSGAEIAAVLVEPVAGNMGLVPPVEGFLEGLRAVCSQYGALLVFDEVMCGFRVAPGGAQERYAIRPDLTCLGKVIGGGLPVGAYGGREDIMRMIAPDGPVYQAGTLSGNPLAVAAGLATLRLLQRPGTYDALAMAEAHLAAGVEGMLHTRGVTAVYAHVGSMAGLFFGVEAVRNYDEAKTSDAALFGRFFWACARRGVYLAPSAFEAWFLSTTHTPEVIDAALSIMGEALDEALAT